MRASKQAVTLDVEMDDNACSSMDDELGVNAPNGIEMNEDDEVVEELDSIIHFMDSLATGPDN